MNFVFCNKYLSGKAYLLFYCAINAIINKKLVIQIGINTVISFIIVRLYEDSYTYFLLCGFFALQFIKS